MPICATHEPFDAILEVNDIEVYKQSYGFATELQVRKDLSLMDGGYGVNGLQFNDHKVLDHKVNAVADV